MKTKKGISVSKFLLSIFSIFVLIVVVVMTYGTIKNKILLNKIYDDKVVNNTVSAREFFTEYNTQLNNYNLTSIKDSQIKYRETNKFSYNLAELAQIDIDDYHIYANWKPKADSYPPNFKVFMKLDVFSKSISYQNLCKDYISEDYDIATLKAMRNSIINNGYECISEEEILDHYYATRKDNNGEYQSIKLSPDLTLSICVNNIAVNISLGINKDS